MFKVNFYVIYNFFLYLKFKCKIYVGKSMLVCLLSRELYIWGKLFYIFDGDNFCYGLNKDFGFKVEDRVENICRVGKYIVVYYYLN